MAGDACSDCETSPCEQFLGYKTRHLSNESSDMSPGWGGGGGVHGGG